MERKHQTKQQQKNHKPTKTYSDKALKLSKAKEFRASTDNPALPEQLREPNYLS